MSMRFEILKYGERVRIARINGDGILSLSLTYVKHSGQKHSRDLQISGLEMLEGSQDRQHRARWQSPDGYDR